MFPKTGRQVRRGKRRPRFEFSFETQQTVFEKKESLQHSLRSVCPVTVQAPVLRDGDWVQNALLVAVNELPTLIQTVTDMLIPLSEGLFCLSAFLIFLGESRIGN